MQGIMGLFAWCAGLLVLLQVTAAGRPAEDQMFLKRELEIAGKKYGYRVYVPPGHLPDQPPLPIILFLHGAGERGSDGVEQTRIGIGPQIERHPDWFRAIVVMPQCAQGSWWTGAMEEFALGALAAAEQEFHTDKKRVYLTGLSMGGYATWALAAKQPGRFAAIVPVCGGVRVPWDRKPVVGDPYLDVAKKVRHLPIWIFHGAKDPTVPVEESRKMHAALKSLEADVRYTEYEQVRHQSWEQAYADPQLWKWLGLGTV